MSLSRLIGSRLRERRLALGLRQVDVARTAGMSAAMLNLIEHNRRRVSDAAGARLAAVLRTDIAGLGGDAGEALGTALRGAAAGTAAELDRLDEFIGRFPGWAGALADAHLRLEQAERAVLRLSEEMIHDPFLSDAVHDLLSALSALRSTAPILAETEDIDPEWRARFHRNLHLDAERMAGGAEALVAYLAGAGSEAKGVTASPQEEVDAWLDQHGWHLEPLEEGRMDAVAEGIARLASEAARALATEWAKTAERDVRAMPMPALLAALDRVGRDPITLAAAFGVPVLAAFRRLATLPNSPLGLVICDGSGTLIFRKPAQGFAVPRFGSACALWPLFEALARPLQPVERQVMIAGRMGETTFRLRAYCQPQPPTAFGAPDLRLGAMLIEPASASGAPLMAVGSTCRICTRLKCPARREPSILSAG